ncbi:serine hydrolase [uncultured Tenacibaculum sp.]|uniref:serine hydrolase n=1 Tax=uncultured Tenacibaculum sp. TaxID=174713 RepID=UPI00260406F0|nr:serine hydrolase [uncultured Tenacibaculum sp.]
MKRTLFILFVSTLLQAGVITTFAQNSSLYTKIDNYLTAGVENGFSGAIALVKNGEVIINKGYGYANKDTQTLNNPNTIFDIGSNTKQFTATAILKLAELGKLELTDSIATYFKNVPADKQGITIHQLLSHSAGFVDAIGRDFTEISQEDFFQQLFATKLLFEPGTKYEYSNTGYSILGRIIELTSGQPYEVFLKEQLFIPAGMHQTGYLLPTWNSKQISRSYNRGILESDSPILRYQKDKGLNWHLKANGGINATQNDLLLWYQALKTNKILSKTSYQKLITPHISYGNGKYTYGYTYGWTHRVLDNKMKRLAHNGSNGAYSHSIIWFPEEDIYITYATNANSDNVEFIAYTITRMLLDENYTPKPIKNNIYAFIMRYVEQNPLQTSNNLIKLLKEQYSEEFNKRPLNTIGNLLLQKNKHVDWAIELFKQNMALNPQDGNLWDSLGDGYKANQQKEEAIKAYQKAVSLGYKDAQQKLTALLTK